MGRPSRLLLYKLATLIPKIGHRNALIRFFWLLFILLQGIRGVAQVLPSDHYWSPNQRHAFALSLFDLGDYKGAQKECLILLVNPELLADDRKDSLYYLAAQCEYKKAELSASSARQGLLYYNRISVNSPQLFNHSRIAEGYIRLMYDAPNEVTIPSLTAPWDSSDAEHIAFQRCLFPLVTMPERYHYKKLKAFRQSWNQYHELRADFKPRSLVLRKALRQTDTLVWFYSRKKEKSPALAGTLAFLVPGGGKAYLGNWGQATMIFFTTTMLGLIAYEGHYRKADWQLYSFGTLAAGYHLLNIYSATISIKVFNRDLRHQYHHALRSAIAPVLDDVLLFR